MCIGSSSAFRLPTTIWQSSMNPLSSSSTRPVRARTSCVPDARRIVEALLQQLTPADDVVQRRPQIVIEASRHGVEQLQPFIATDRHEPSRSGTSIEIGGCGRLHRAAVVLSPERNPVATAAARARSCALCQALISGRCRDGRD
jgi:hypothetical protein